MDTEEEAASEVEFNGSAAFERNKAAKTGGE